MRELSLPDRCSGVTPVHGGPICGQSGRSAVVAGLERDLWDVGRARLLHLDIGSLDYLAPLDDLLLDLAPEFLLRVGYHVETKPFEARLHVRKIQGFDDLAVKQVLDFLRRCRLYQHRLKSIGLLALEAGLVQGRDEAGFKGQEADTFQAMLIQAATPKEIQDLLHREIVKALNLPDVKARLEGLGLDVVANLQEEFGAQIKQEIVKWRKVIRAANIKVE